MQVVWDFKPETVSLANLHLIKHVLKGLLCSAEHIPFFTFISKLLNILLCHKTRMYKQMHLPFFLPHLFKTCFDNLQEKPRQISSIYY